jgi:hypothetical protein
MMDIAGDLGVHSQSTAARAAFFRWFMAAWTLALQDYPAQ